MGLNVPTDTSELSVKGLGGSRKINCDQVAWAKNAIRRVMSHDINPAVSRQQAMNVYACLYELMEVLDLGFEDDGARSNATPEDVRMGIN